MKTIFMLALLTTMTASAQAPQTPKVTSLPSKEAAHTAQQHANDGQRVFEQNCSRCHNPPDGFSPRISGTIVRHMRVRANLSEADAKALMKFFHP